MRISLITMLLAEKDSCVHLAHVHSMFSCKGVAACASTAFH